ncbi:MAG: hypothetical protein NTY77_08140 [Elusimicrobia bacterium]|nr:hypothetical protein [Elusimicrobiota bacterium]
MPFNSAPFFVFFAVVAAVYYCLRGTLRRAFLLLASYVFYMSWSPSYGLLLLATTASVYLAARVIAWSRVRSARLALLVCGMAVPFGLLTYFKYGAVLLSDASILLPLGLSFYAFQSVSYLLDVYDGRIPAERHFGLLALYISFFPLLTAGPIERAGKLIPQLAADAELDCGRIASGLKLILCGLFKKIVIADTVAVFVSAAYGDPDRYRGLPILLATMLSRYQIFCDFSGYTDIAIGCARILGIDLSQNFRRPFFASSPSDFWRRMHITLVGWFRDYVLFPMSRRFSSPWQIRCNIVLVFFLVGLWHGPTTGYILWGLLHGLILVGENLTVGPRRRLAAAVGLTRWPGFHRALQSVFTFFLLCLPTVLARSGSWAGFRRIGSGLCAGTSAGFLNAPAFRGFFSAQQDVVQFIAALVMIAAMECVHGLQARTPIEPWLARKPWPLRWAVYYLLVLALILFGNFNAKTFYYFQF